MRLLQVLVEAEDRQALLDTLDDEAIDYVVEDARASVDGDDAVLVEFPLPNQAVEQVRDRISEAGIESQYLVTITAEAADTERFDELEDRFITGTEADDSISPTELRSRALGLHPDPSAYYVMTLISALVAVAGLVLDSAALVVGAMVIAPQVGSALMTSVGATLGDRPMLERGIRAQVLSLTLAILGSVFFGVVVQSVGSVSPVIHLETIGQIGERISPGLLTLAVGVAAGIAGSIGLATALPVSIVGVMIAAALIPAAAATGIGIAWGNPSVAIGAFVLLVANLVAVNVGGYATLRAFGYDRSDDAPEFPIARSVLVGIVLLGILLPVGAAFAMQATFENGVNGAVEDVLAADRYEELELVSTRADFVFVPGSDPPSVQVVVARPADRDYPTLAADLARAIHEETGREVAVHVEFVEGQQYEPPDQSAAATARLIRSTNGHSAIAHRSGARNLAAPSRLTVGPVSASSTERPSVTPAPSPTPEGTTASDRRERRRPG